MSDLAVTESYILAMTWLRDMTDNACSPDVGTRCAQPVRSAWSPAFTDDGHIMIGLTSEKHIMISFISEKYIIICLMSEENTL